MKRIATLLLLLIAFNNAFTQEISIIPQPAELKTSSGSFTINSSTELVLLGSRLENSAAFLNDYLNQFYGFKLKTVKQTKSKNVIRINFERMDNPIPGAYTLEVGNDGVYIAGDNETGAFYGIQTLIQLLPTEKSSALNIPFVSVTDKPRFGYRGVMLDVSRHFFPVEYVKKFIDYLALHKMNYFHWHLTDDQGWRIEIKKYPKLQTVAAYRNGTIIGRYPGTGNTNQRYGGFYTQEQVKEVVKYASARYITVIPEIEMPGHASAAIAAYPQLSCFPNESTKFDPRATWSGDTSGKQVQQTWGVHPDVFAPTEETFKFLQDVLDEVIPLFPSKFIHIGGDECPKDNWKRSAYAQKLIKDKNLKDEHGLQSYFVQRMEKYINSKGKSIIGWDEILEGGLAPNATVMSWRGEKGGIEAARLNHNVIMTPNTYVYFDYSQTRKEDSVVIGGFLPIQKVYSYEPLPSELPANQAKYILGGQSNLWTEYINNPGKAEYMLFPRVSALSEVLWTPKDKKSWNDFEKRLPTQLKRFDLWGTHYSKAYQDPASVADKK